MKKDIEERIGDRLTIIIMIFMIVIAILLIVGHSNQNSSVGPNSNISQNVSEDKAGLTTGLTTDLTTGLTTEDKDFKIWLSISYTPIHDDLKCISNAAKKKNFTEIEWCAKFLKENSNRSLGHIYIYNVSDNMQNIADEYKMSLEDFNIGGTYLEIGAKNRDIQLMANGSSYIKNGTIHIGRVSAMYSDLLPESNPING